MELEPSLKCRLCGVLESNTLLMCSIVKPENYIPKIHKVLPISIHEYDPLPKRICYSCKYKVDEFYLFIVNSVKMQETLKRDLSWFDSSDVEVNTGSVSKRRRSRFDVTGSSEYESSSRTVSNEKCSTDEEVTSTSNGKKVYIGNNESTKAKYDTNKEIMNNKLKQTLVNEVVAKAKIADCVNNMKDKNVVSSESGKTKTAVSNDKINSRNTSSGNNSFKVKTAASNEKINSRNSGGNESFKVKTAASYENINVRNSESNENFKAKTTTSNDNGVNKMIKKNVTNKNATTEDNCSSSKLNDQLPSFNETKENERTKSNLTIPSGSRDTIVDKGNKKEKLTLTLRKNDEDSELWSVPPAQSVKRKADDSNPRETVPAQSKTSRQSLSENCVSISNTKENDGQISNRNTSLSKSETLKQSNSNEVTNSDTSDKGIPSYLLATNIPLAGTVYTCVHCEQTFVSKSTACTHRCEGLLDSLPRENCDEKEEMIPYSPEATVNKQIQSPLAFYTCELCNQPFSRQASLIAHQAAHEKEDFDQDSDSEADINGIFFGQHKREKRKKISSHKRKLC